MWPDAVFYPHTVHVEDLLGSGGMGKRFGSEREVAAEVRDEQTVVRDADGQEIVSSTTVTVKLAANVPNGSRVTVWKGKAGERTAHVVKVGREENPRPLDSFLVLSLE
jgi:O-phosphoseryl-tRNA(Cys) synthetase